MTVLTPDRYPGARAILPARHPARTSAIPIDMIIGGKILEGILGAAGIALLGSESTLIIDAKSITSCRVKGGSAMQGR